MFSDLADVKQTPICHINKHSHPNPYDYFLRLTASKQLTTGTPTSRLYKRKDIGGTKSYKSRSHSRPFVRYFLCLGKKNHRPIVEPTWKNASYHSTTKVAFKVELNPI